MIFPQDYIDRQLHSNQADLLRLFPLRDLSGNPIDRSPNGDDGTVSGATQASGAMRDGWPSYSLDGVNDYVDLNGAAIATDLTDKDVFSVGIWWKVDDINVWTDSTVRVLFHWWPDASDALRVSKRSTDDTLQIWMETNNNQDNVESTIWADTNWHFLYVRVDANAGSRLFDVYMDAVFIGTGTLLASFGAKPAQVVYGAHRNKAQDFWAGSLGPITINDSYATLAQMQQGFIR